MLQAYRRTREKPFTRRQGPGELGGSGSGWRGPWPGGAEEPPEELGLFMGSSPVFGQ